MNNASITDRKLRSPLSEAMLLKPSARPHKKSMIAALCLTSLVDAFSIMLLYLLVQNSGNGSTLEINKAEQLPTAVKTEALHQGTIVRVEGKQYFLGDNEVQATGLAAALQQLKAEASGEAAEAIIIQADKNVDFAALTPVIRAGSITGFNKFKFAVLQGEDI